MMSGEPTRLFALVTTAAIVAIGGLTIVRAQQPPPAAVYTAAQAEAGRASFQETCAGCHSNDLSGNGDAPELAGRTFIGSWKNQTTQDLFKYVQGMPPGGPHLPTEDYLPIVAYILQQNGAAAGDQPFTANTTGAIGTIATGERPAAPKP